jgi:Ni/Co efflux regulator RcnB
VKKTLGLIGMMVCSAGLFALPAAAADRGDHDNFNRTYNNQPAQNYRFDNNTKAKREDVRFDHSDRRRDDRRWRKSRYYDWRHDAYWR